MRELESTEKLLWRSQPRPTFFTGEAVGTFLFGIPWTAFAIFWTCGAAGFQIPDLSEGFHIRFLFPLFGLPFIIVGLFMLATPVMHYRKMSSTLYAITTQRILIMESNGKTEYTSIAPQRICELTRRETDQGYGDLIISHEFSIDSDGDKQTKEIGFFNISQVKEVEKIVKKLIEKNTRPSKNQSDWELED
jgi:hypothetical protein